MSLGFGDCFLVGWLVLCLLLVLDFFCKSHIYGYFSYTNRRQKRKPTPTVTQVINLSIKLLSRHRLSSETAQVFTKFSPNICRVGGSLRAVKTIDFANITLKKKQKSHIGVQTTYLSMPPFNLLQKKLFYLANFNLFPQLCPQILVTVLLAPFLPQ